ncbi:MAG: adenosylcobinamide-GDP ribazoletransferase [Eggerthellaceae bacterium]|nr:adenosylcobinamide-GDP ribazoletransferase [Eggerthellaceae bacterium]
MSVLRAIVSALALFTRIPMPPLNWEKANMRHTLAALPLVGVLVAALLWLWLAACNALGLHTLLFAAGLALVPVLVTGGIHLDGYCDTVDALSSHAPLEKKREILKDPHAGAFAVIGVAVYLVAYVAFCSELEQSLATVLLLGAAAVMSRALGAFACLVFSPSEGKGLMSTLRDASAKTGAIVCACWFILAGVGALVLDWRCAIAIIVVAVLVTAYVRNMSKRLFGGMSGDLAGYLIQLVELGAVVALVVVEKVVVLL